MDLEKLSQNELKQNLKNPSACGYVERIAVALRAPRKLALNIKLHIAKTLIPQLEILHKRF